MPSGATFTPSNATTAAGSTAEETGRKLVCESDAKKFLFTFWQDKEKTGRGSHMWLQPHTISSAKSVGGPTDYCSQ